MTIRLQDIASDLNLSKMTISKVLRGQTDVSAETKARVLQRARELNYRPNVTARSLRTGQTYSVGLVSRSTLDSTLGALVAGANEVLREAGYSLVVSSADGDPLVFEREVELHLSRQVDLLLLYASDRATGQTLAPALAETPCIHLGQRPSSQHGLFVGLREEALGRLAAQHLLSCGCTRLAYLREPRTAAGDERFSGFLATLRAAGLTLRQEWIVEAHPGQGEYRAGVEATARLLSGRPRPDGMMAWTDLAASGVRDALLDSGLQIPGQVQILGCGNREDICQLRLPLSSIDLGAGEAGRRAARLGLKLLQKRRPAQATNIWTPARIVQRASTQLITRSG